VYGMLPPPPPSRPSYDAFNQEGDPPDLKLCRPCRDGAHIGPAHDCDGPPCECLICRDIAPVVEEMQEDWAMREREQGWR